jgi:choline-phosphate cytidylyltransferase
VRVITYGTFDLLHEGHRRLLERAKALGDYLVVGVTSQNYDNSRGKLNVSQSLMERIKNVTDTGLVDEILVEEYEGQKIHDIQRLGIDVFAIGSDWLGRFDYLNDYCQVVYLDRTKGVSSTELRTENFGILSVGVVGSGRIAARFVAESRFVSGVSVEAVWSPTPGHASAFAEKHELERNCGSFAELLAGVRAVYIATPHGTHYELARQALSQGVHVLCEKPLSLDAEQAAELYGLAARSGLVLVEAVKTAFSPGFQHLVAVARSGSIGDIRAVEATFTKLMREGREFAAPDGGSLSELASYPLLVAVKLLGADVTGIRTRSYWPQSSQVELFSQIDLDYPTAIATARTGIGVKSEGDLVISGTEGYIYVPAPWWLTEYFETRFEDPTRNRKYFYKFEGDGLRYELADFAQLIREGRTSSFKYTPAESIAVARILSSARRSAEVFGRQSGKEVPGVG